MVSGMLLQRPSWPLLSVSPNLCPNPIRLPRSLPPLLLPRSSPRRPCLAIISTFDLQPWSDPWNPFEGTLDSSSSSSDTSILAACAGSLGASGDISSSFSSSSSSSSDLGDIGGASSSSSGSAASGAGLPLNSGFEDPQLESQQELFRASEVVSLQQGGGGGGEGSGPGDGGNGGGNNGGNDGGNSDDSGNEEEDDDGIKKKSGKMSMSQKLTLAYAALVSVGGIMGFLKGKSTKSLASGLISGSLLYYVSTQLATNPVYASSIGLAVSVLLLMVMGSRFKKSGKIFPAGIVSFVSLVMVGGYGHGIMRSSHV